MKFSEMPYVRPDLEALRQAAETAVTALDAASSAQAQCSQSLWEGSCHFWKMWYNGGNHGREAAG